MRESAKTLMYVFVGTRSFEGVRRQEGADLQSGQAGQVKDLFKHHHSIQTQVGVGTTVR